MLGNQPRAKSHLQVETDLQALEQVLQWFQKFIMPLLPGNLGWQCQLALTEGFTNVVRHAHKYLPPTTPIKLEVEVFSHYLEMRVWDQGKPFNLEEKLKLVLAQECDCDPLEQKGGRGLIFMHKLTDELDYIRTADHRNCLVMKKRLI